MRYCTNTQRSNFKQNTYDHFPSNHRKAFHYPFLPKKFELKFSSNLPKTDKFESFELSIPTNDSKAGTLCKADCSKNDDFVRIFQLTAS